MTGLTQYSRESRKRTESLGIEAGHENNRSAGGRGIVAQLPNHRVAVEYRHHQIKQDGVRPQPAGDFVGFEAVGGRGDSKTGADGHPEKCQMIDVVVNDQHEPPRV